MKFTASRRLYLLLCVGVAIFAAAYFVEGAHTLGLVFDALILVAVAVDFQLTPRPKLITATRDNQERLSIGRINDVFLYVQNKSSLDLRVQVKDDCPLNLNPSVEVFECTIKSGEQITLKYEVVPRRRGLYKFGDIHVRYLSFLGLFYRESTSKAEKGAKVYSDLKALYDLSIKLSRTTELGELHQRKRGQGTDFASLREYTVGDDSKLIDWKATARRDRPVVRTYEVEQEQRLLILIDAGRMMLSDLEGLTRFDHALNAGLCLALTGLTHNDQVSFGIFADKPLAYLPPRRGKAYLKKILEAVFDVEPKMIEPDYLGMLSYFASMQKGRCLMVLLTDLTDAVGSQSMLAGLASLAGRHLPFCVTLKDRQVTEMSHQGVLKDAHDKSVPVDEIYRRAVACDLLSQRELALNVLHRRGCLVLDCPPQELSDKLVDTYLEIKTRGRL